MVDSRDTPEAILHGIAADLAARTRRYETQRDARCVFTYCYWLMTLQLERELAASACTDRLWIANLAFAFSARYFNALDRYDAREASVPPSWQMVFDTVKDRWTSVFEDLIFGMTAHIVADLPHALLDVGMTDGTGRARVADFHAVNDILGNSIELIRRRVAKRYAYPFSGLDRIGGAHGVIVTDFGIRLARGIAWYNAVRLQDPQIEVLAAESIQKSAIAVVDDIANPPFWSVLTLLRIWRVFLSFFRRWPGMPLERDGVGR